MRIVRINKGKAIGLPVRLLLTAGMIVMSIYLMNLLPEPWSILVVMIVATIFPGIWFASKVIIVDEERKRLFDGVWTMGCRLGPTLQYGTIEDIAVEKEKIKPTLFSLPDNKDVVVNHEFRAYITLSTGEKYYLLSHPLEDRIHEKVTKIRKKLRMK